MPKLLKLTKLEDLKFNGNHPNGINTGRTQIGYEVYPLEIGKRYTVASFNAYLSTSFVTKINTDGTFETENSIYKLEPYNETT